MSAEAASGGTAQVIDARRLGLDGSGWELLGAACDDCGAVAHPYRRRCALCGGATARRTLRPAGRVVSSTVVRLTRPDVLLTPPFQVLLVRLDDGPLLRVPSTDLAPFEAGEPVGLEALTLGEGPDRVVAFQARHLTGGAA